MLLSGTGGRRARLDPHTAQLAGYRDILTIDVGGTSTDVSIIENYQPRYTSTSMVENYPVKTPMLDIVTVGAGGGSIAWTDSYGQLKVGPQSAGADPGPDLLRQGRHRADRYRCGRHPRTPAGRSGRRRDRARRPTPRAARSSRSARKWASIADELAAGALEVAAANQVVRYPPGDDRRAAASPATMPWSPSAAPAGCLPPRSPTSSASIRCISPPDPGNLCAFGLHVSDVTPRLYPHPGSPAEFGPTPTRSLAAWRELETARIRRHRGRGDRKGRDRRALHRRRPLFRRGHEVQVDIPRRIVGPRRAGFHVGGLPRGARPHLRFQLSRPAGCRAGQSPRAGCRQAASSAAQGCRGRRVRLRLPSRGARSIGDRPAGSTCRCSAAPSLLWTSTLADRRSSRSTAPRR